MQMAAQSKIKSLTTIPQTEILCVRLYNSEQKLTHVITQKKLVLPIKFVLYEVHNEKEYKFVAEANNPNDLEAQYVWKKQKGKKDESI